MKKLLSAAVLSPVLLSTQAIANDHFNEVIVEATYLSSNEANSIKTPTPILDVPQSLSIITAEQITQQGFTTIADLINYTPGVNTSQGEGHRDAVVFRGVRSTADFYIDGVRDGVQYYRPLYNLEQVEILRGPNALLFGRGGTGGILNRVTKKPELGSEFTGYQVGIDTFGEYNLQIDSNIAVSDTSALRINAYYADLENHRDFYDGDRLGINPTMRFAPSDDTTIDVSYEYIDHERFIDRGIPTGANGEPVEAFEDIVFGDPDLNKTELEAHIFRANVQHNFSDSLKANLSAHYGNYDKFYQNFYASCYNDDDDCPGTDVVTLDGYVDTTQRENLILSANLVNEFETGAIGHTLIVGAEYIDTSSDQDRYNAVWTPDGNADSDTEIFTIVRPLNLRGGVGVNSNGTPVTNSFSTDLNDDTRVDIEVSSFYIQDEIAISEHFDLILGARFDSFDIEVNNVDEDSTSFGVRSRKDEEISPRAGLIYKPQENISIYASYSESFLPRSGEQYANINGQVDTLAPDEFENTEFGVKWDFDNGLSLTAAYFKNEQTRADRDNLTGEAFEIRGLEVDGFELELQGQITDELSVRAGYTSLDGETGSFTKPRELPENMASVWGAYQASDKLGFGLGVIYQDESLISDGSSAKLPSYTRVDAAAYYDISDDLRIQLNIENLTDELYFPNSHATHQATVGEPVNARLTISGRF